MEETNSIKDAIKERLTSPFLGKLVITWLLWNWKIPYVTFFVDTNDLDSKNKLDYVSQYLEIDSGSDFLFIHGIPILITAFLIWVFPYLSHEAYKSSENFRKKNALKKKETDDDISNSKDEKIRKLEDEIKSFKNQNIEESYTIRELRLLVEYLGFEFENQKDENYDNRSDFFLEQYRNEISDKEKKDRVFVLLDDFHKSSDGSYFDNLNKNQKSFLIKNGIINKEDNVLRLSLFGEFISKNILYDEYSNHLMDFHSWHNLNY